MVWSDFVLYQSPRRLYVKGIDVREDFLDARGSRRRLETAMAWHQDLARRLPQGAADDRLLSLLYGSMKHLANGVPPFISDCRFRLRWASLWGTAPELDACAECGARLPLGEDETAALSDEGPLCEQCAARSRSARDRLPTVSAASLSSAVRAATIPRASFAEQADEHERSIRADDRAALGSWIRAMTSV